MGLPTYTWNAEGVCLGMGYSYGNQLWSLNATANSAGNSPAGPRSLGMQIRNDMTGYQIEIIESHFRPAFRGIAAAGGGFPSVAGIARISGATGGVAVVGVPHDSSFSLPAQVEARRRSVPSGITSMCRFSPVLSWPHVGATTLYPFPTRSRISARSSKFSGRPGAVAGQLAPITLREGEGFALVTVGDNLGAVTATGAIGYDITVRNPSTGGVWVFTFPEMTTSAGLSSCASIMNRTGSGVVLRVIAIEAWTESSFNGLLGVGSTPTVAAYVHSAAYIDPDGFLVDETDKVVPHDSNQGLRSGVKTLVGGVPFQVATAIDWKSIPVSSAVRDGSELSSMGRLRRIQSSSVGGWQAPVGPATGDVILQSRGGTPAAIIPPCYQFGVGGVPTFGVVPAGVMSSPAGMVGDWLVGDIETTFQVRPVKGIPRVRAA